MARYLFQPVFFSFPKLIFFPLTIKGQTCFYAGSPFIYKIILSISYELYSTFPNFYRRNLPICYGHFHLTTIALRLTPNYLGTKSILRLC